MQRELTPEESAAVLITARRPPVSDDNKIEASIRCNVILAEENK